jgi:hypothetical protein
MAQQLIDVGNVANDGQGDPLRTAFIKTNDNFTELYNIGGLTGIQNGNSNITIAANSTINMAVAGTPDVVVVYDTGLTVTGLVQADEISSVGNVYSDYYFGNGALLSGLSSQNANALTGTTLAASVVNSSLTRVGALANLSVTGNITGSTNANITSLLRAGNIITPGTLNVGQGATFGNAITAGGTISTTGDIIGNNIIGTFTFASLSTSGNVTGANLVTSGLVTATGNAIVGNVVTAGLLSAAGNVTGNYIIGNGSLLTGLPASYGNANVASYLPTYTGALTGSTLSLSGNIISNTSVSGNVTASYFIGNGSQLTGIVATGIGTLTSLSVTGNAVIDGNVVSGTVVTGPIKGSTLSLSGAVQSPLNSTSDFSTSGNLYSGNGLIGYLSVVSNVDVAGAINASSNVNGANFNGYALNVTNHVYVTGTGNSIWTAGDITGSNVTSGAIYSSGVVSAGGNVRGSNFNTAGIVSAEGNVISGNVLSGGIVSAAGNITGGNLSIGIINSSAVSATGNINSGNILTGGIISATGNIVSDGFFIGTFLGNITGNLVVPGLNGQVLYNNAGNAGASAGLTFTSGTNTLSTGNVYADYFYGNGAGLTGIQATVVGVLSSLSVTGNAVVGNLSTTGQVQAGSISASGNVTAGNINVTTDFSTIGNITSSFYFGNAIEIEDHVWSGGTGNVFWTAGNITGANMLSYGMVSAAGNITGGNISIVGNVDASTINSSAVYSFGLYGNAVEAEDHIYVGTSVAAGNSIWTSGNITGANLLSTGSISTSGNITGNNVTAVNLMVLSTHASDPTGIQGGIYYNSAFNKFRVFNGSLWANITTS